MTIRGWTRCALLLTFAGLPVAHAQSAAEKATAEALFDEGKRLMAAQRFGEACPKLADSQHLDPAVGTLLNLALCYKSNGQTASAWSTYREAAAQAHTTRAEEREKLARKEASSLEPQLTRLVIEVSPEAANTPGLEIKRDGASVPSGLWGVASPVDPGQHVVDVTAPGKRPLQLAALAEGAGVTTPVSVGPLEDATAAPPAAIPPPPAVNPALAPAPPAEPPRDAGTKPGSGQRVLGYVVGGLGVVGVGVGAVFALGAMSDNDSAKKVCPEFPQGDCSQDDVDRHDKLLSQAKASRLNSFVGFGLGGVGLIAGAIIILTAPSEPAKQTSFSVTPTVVANGYGIDLSGSF